MKRDHLDEAIDAIAARLTYVDEDRELASRIVAALPERTAGLAQGWVARFALGAVATIALMVATGVIVQRSFDGRSTEVLRTFHERSTDVLRAENARAPIVELARAVTAQAPGTPIVEPLLIVRRTTVERSSNDRRTIPDHEFSLAAITPPEALRVGSLTPDALPTDDALAIAPLALADLPSMDESRFPR